MKFYIFDVKIYRDPGFENDFPPYLICDPAGNVIHPRPGLTLQHPSEKYKTGDRLLHFHTDLGRENDCLHNTDSVITNITVIGT